MIEQETILTRQSETIEKSKREGLPRVANWALRFFIMLMVPFLLAVGSARLVMNPAFLNFEYQRQGFPVDLYGFTVEDRMEYGPYGVLYITNNEPIEYLGDLELPGYLCFPPRATNCPAFNPLELSHMHDVQVVAQGLFMGGILGFLGAILAGAILVRGSGSYALRLALMQGGMLTVGLIVTVVLLAVTAWDLFFSGFHSLFFEAGTWQFYYSDTLIRLYPEQFWFDASILAGMMTLLGAVLILVVALRVKASGA